MERRRHSRPRVLASASVLALAAALVSARAANAVIHTSIIRDVGIRATEPGRPAAQHRSDARAAPDPSRSDGTPGTATNARGATGANALLVQQHDGRDRRRAPDSRIVLAQSRSRSLRPRPVSVTAAERMAAGHGAVFHDAHAPPAATLDDAAGHRS
jgi:hypothetical protein